MGSIAEGLIGRFSARAEVVFFSCLEGDGDRFVVGYCGLHKIVFVKVGASRQGLMCSPDFSRGRYAAPVRCELKSAMVVGVSKLR